MKKNRVSKRLSILLVFIFAFTQMGAGFNSGGTKVYARDTTSAIAAPTGVVSIASGDLVIVNWNTVFAATSYNASINGVINICKDNHYEIRGMKPEDKFEVKIQATEGTNNSDWSSAILVSSTGAFIPATPSPSPTPPAAPNVSFSFTGDNGGKLIGLTMAMEYSLTGDGSYFSAPAMDARINTNAITAVNGIRVRIKANGTVPAGIAQIIGILPGPSSLPAVDGNDVTNTIAGLDSTMEFSIDGGNTWTPYNNNPPAISGNVVVKVRKKADGLTAPGIGVKTLTYTSVVPAAPNVSFSFSGTNAGRLMGSSTMMEYSLDGGVSYIPITVANVEIKATEINADNDIRVRVKATGTASVGYVQLININAGATIAPAVTGNDILNTITGITTTMEFSTNSVTWTAYTGNNLPNLSGALILKIRVKGSDLTMPGTTTTLVYTAPVTPTPAAVSGGGGVASPSTESFPVLPSVAGMNVIASDTAAKVSATVGLMRNAMQKTDGVTPTKTAENIGSAATQLKDLAGIIPRVTDPNASKELVDQIEALLGAINSAATRTIDEVGATKTIDGLNAIFASSEALLNAIKDDTQKKAISQQLLSLIKVTNQNLGNITSGDKTIQFVGDMINNSTAVMAATKDEQIALEMNSEFNGLAKAALKKIGQQTVVPIITKDVAKTSITDSVLAELMGKIETVGNKKSSFETKLTQNGGAKVNATFVINVTGTNGSTISQIEIPSKVVSAINGKGINELEIRTGIANVVFPAGAINVAGTSMISLKVKQIDSSRELTKDQKSAVGDSPVFDFSLDAVKKDGKKVQVSMFKEDVNISVPYILKAGQDPTKITVFFINSKGIMENMAGHYDGTTQNVNFSTNHFSKYFIKENKLSFVDLKGFEDYKVFIEALTAKGIMQGKGNKFIPTENVTKGKLACLLASISKNKCIPDKTTDSKLKDVKKADMNYSAYAMAIKAGVLGSDKNGMFKPETKLTREEFAVAIANWAEVNKGWTVSAAEINSIGYTDKKLIKPTSLKSVALLTKYFVMIAKSGTDYKPGDFVNKAEASKIIYQLINTK